MYLLSQWASKTRRDAWRWIGAQVTDNVKDSLRLHANRVGDIGHISPKISYRLGMCGFALYVQPQMAEEWFDFRSTICKCRMQHFQWGLASHRGRLREVRPSLSAYWAATGGTLDRFRRRSLRVRVRATSGDDGSYFPGRRKRSSGSLRR